MNDYVIGTHFYICDPEKNKKCAKTNCYLKGGNCALTTNPSMGVHEQPLGPAEGWGASRKGSHYKQAVRSILKGCVDVGN